MKTIACLICCLWQLILSAQDTIYKRTGEVVAAKVLEISVKEVSYKRADLPDGPLIIVNKNDIRKIKYAPGMLDSFAIVKPEPPRQVLVNQPASIYQDNNLIHASLRKGVYEYREHQISDKKVLFMAMERNLLWQNRDIDLNIAAAKRNKALQCAIGFAGAGVGGAGIYGSLIATSFSSNPGDNFTVAAVGTTFLGILISSQIVSYAYKMKRIKHTDKVAELYNQLSKN
ncbi:MAG: hypothetical protein HY062_12780 [Bacteroidetes bacterium]|nr:hypothetical protein [Bacteroidota bacterium]